MTVTITAFVTSSGVPLESPSTLPTIRIRRVDTGALVVTDSSCTEVGDGNYKFDFSESPLDYTAVIDADPGELGQVTGQERYHESSFSGIDAVWGADIQGVDGTDFSTAGKALNAIRQAAFNTIRPAVVGNAASLVLLEDDNIAVKATFGLLDVNNGAVSGVAGQPGNRAKGV